MDMKDIVISDQMKWLDDIENNLNQFPILLRSNEWVTGGTTYHHQPGLEIHLIHEGTGTMVIGKHVLLQSPRSVVIYRGSVPHQMISKSTYKRSVICLDLGGERTDSLLTLHRLIDFSWIPHNSYLSFSLSQKKFQQLEMMCSVLRLELDTLEVGWERIALSQVLQVSVFLQRCMGDSSETESQEAESKGRKSDLVQLCSDYICSHLGENLSLKRVSKTLAVSEEYLTRSFTKEIGISFYQYVLLQRVAEGRRLLREAPDVSISEIAYLIGFPSSSHFSRHFKVMTEETPSSYRQRTLSELT